MTKMTKTDVKSLFPGRFYEADHTEQVFGFRPKEIPLPRYWTVRDYEAHSNAGHCLICYPNRLQNLEPLTLEAMARRAIAGKSLPEGILWPGQFDKQGETVERSLQNDLLLKYGIPHPGWQFVSQSVLPETGNKDSVDQTDVLIGNMQRLLGHALPPAFWEAKAKWETYERSIVRMLFKNRHWFPIRLL